MRETLRCAQDNGRPLVPRSSLLAPRMSTIPQLEPLPVPPPSPEEVAVEGRVPAAGYWRETWRHFRRRKLSMIALVFVGFLCLVAIFSPAIVGTNFKRTPNSL